MNRIMRSARVALVLSFAMLFPVYVAQAEPQIALMIGNANYGRNLPDPSLGEVTPTPFSCSALEIPSAPAPGLGAGDGESARFRDTKAALFQAPAPKLGAGMRGATDALHEAGVGTSYQLASGFGGRVTPPTPDYQWGSCGSSNLCFEVGVIQLLSLEQNAEDVEQVVSNGPQGAAMGMAAGTEFCIAPVTGRVSLYGDAGPMVDRLLQAFVAGVAAHNDQGLAAALGDRRHATQSSQNMIISSLQRFPSLSEQRGDVDPSVSREGA